MATPATPPSNDDPLANILKQFPGLNLGNGVGTSDPFASFMGNGDVTAPVHVPGMVPPDQIDTFLQTGQKPHDTTKQVGDLFKDFYNLDGQKLKDLQYDLYVGGFFGPTVDPGEISWGTAGDPTTFGAWQQAVVRASRFYASGKKISVDDVIKVAGETAGKDQKPTKAIAQLSDPSLLGKQLDVLAPKVLGRKASTEEKRLFTAMIHTAQRTQAEHMAAAQNPSVDPIAQANAARSMAAGGSASTVTDVVGVSPEAQAENFLRQQDPLGAGARDYADAAGLFFSLLGKNG